MNAALYSETHGAWAASSSAEGSCGMPNFVFHILEPSGFDSGMAVREQAAVEQMRTRFLAGKLFHM